MRERKSCFAVGAVRGGAGACACAGPVAAVGAARGRGWEGRVVAWGASEAGGLEVGVSSATVGAAVSVGTIRALARVGDAGGLVGLSVPVGAPAFARSEGAAGARRSRVERIAATASAANTARATTRRERAGRKMPGCQPIEVPVDPSEATAPGARGVSRAGGTEPIPAAREMSTRVSSRAQGANARARSLALGIRADASFSRHLRTTASSAGGTCARAARSCFGDCTRIADKSSPMDSPSKGGAPAKS
jgi:hypothetical protein